MFVEMHRFFNLLFSNSEQLPAAKKGFKNGASQQTGGPSYFDKSFSINLQNHADASKGCEFSDK